TNHQGMGAADAVKGTRPTAGSVTHPTAAEYPSDRYRPVWWRTLNSCGPTGTPLSGVRTRPTAGYPSDRYSTQLVVYTELMRSDGYALTRSADWYAPARSADPSDRGKSRVELHHPATAV